MQIRGNYIVRLRFLCLEELGDHGERPLALIFAANPEITFRFLESPANAVPATRFVINLVNISIRIAESH
jgi:hypothetical protein